MPINLLGAKRSRRAAGLTASAALHIALLTALGLALRYTPIMPIAPTVEVRLVRMTHTEAKKPPPRAPIRSAASTTTAPPLPVHVPPTPAPVAPPPAMPAPPPAKPAPPDELETLRHGLRLTLGCAHPEDFDLTPAEKDACRKMSTQTHNAAPAFGALSEHIRERISRDEAETAYRGSTSSRDFPGLHCALNDHCTPDRPSEAPTPGGEDCPWAWCHTVR
ncbi:MAG TPA: hypothetical protein VKT30_14870 [Caulobacteraceae bacterium]|nr:hypothetical protein [Caulobacteraceae bacterium]